MRLWATCLSFITRPLKLNKTSLEGIRRPKKVHKINKYFLRKKTDRKKTFVFICGILDATLPRQGEIKNRYIYVLPLNSQ